MLVRERPTPARVLAVDYGKVRVGLAVSDPLGRAAQPLEVVERPRRGSLVDAVVAVARRVGAGEIVVGLPLRLDGTEGAQAGAVRQFARVLAERSGLPVVLWDERFTTAQAVRGMREAGVRSRRQRRVVDKVAAALLLRSYLDARLGPAPDPGEADLPDPPPPPSAGRREPPFRRPEPPPQPAAAPRRRGGKRRRAPRSSRKDWLEEG